MKTTKRMITVVHRGGNMSKQLRLTVDDGVYANLSEIADKRNLPIRDVLRQSLGLMVWFNKNEGNVYISRGGALQKVEILYKCDSR